MSGYLLEGRADPWADPGRRRMLLRRLTDRHLAGRYRGSVLGFAWSLLHPLLMMVVYTFVFAVVLRVERPGVPYPAFFLTGLLAWSFVRVGAMNAATSVLDAAPLIHKTAFPRMLLPLSAVLSNGINYLVTLPLLLAFNAAFGVWPAGSALWLLPGLLLLAAVTVGVGLLAAAAATRYRDVLQLMEIGMTAWMFASPVLYPLARAREGLGDEGLLLYALNPLAGGIGMIHAAFLGQPLPPEVVLPSALVALALLVLGVTVFRRRAPHFAEDC